jgi:hypothetical protein
MRNKISLSAVISCFIIVFMLAGQSYGAAGKEFYGEMKDGTYTNKILGAEIHFSDNWKVLSSDAQKDIHSKASSMSKTYKDITENNDQSQTILHVEANDGSANVVIALMNMGVFGIAFSRTKELLDPILDLTANNVSKMYKEMGFNECVTDKQTVNFLGTEYPCLHIIVKMNGIDILHQKEVMCLSGEYGYMVTVTSVLYDITDDLLNMFRAIR